MNNVVSAPKVIDKVAWLHVAHRSVLFARSRGQHLFFTVGGKRDWLPCEPHSVSGWLCVPGCVLGGRWETDVETLVREVKEECAVTIDASTATFAVEVQGPSLKPGVDVRLRCYFAKLNFGEELRPANEIEELRFLRYRDGRLTTDTGRKVLNWLHVEGYLGL